MAAAGRLSKNLVQLYLAEIFSKALGFATFFFLGRRLGETAYGDLEFGLGVGFVLALLLEGGLGPYGTRRAALDPNATGDLVRTIVRLRLLIFLVALALLGIAASFLDRPSARLLTIVSGASLFPAPFLLGFVFQSRNEMGVLALSSLLRQVVQSLAVFALVKNADDAAVAPLGDAAGLLAVAIWHRRLWGARRTAGTAAPADRRTILKTFRESLPLAASTFAWATRWFAPLLIIGVAAPGAATGFFGAGHRLVVAAHAFVLLWFANLLPTYARTLAESGSDSYRKLQATSLRTVGWLVVIGGMAAVIAAPDAIPICYGQPFQAAVPAFRILVLAVAIAFVSGHARFGLIGAGRLGDDLRANLAGAVVSVSAAVVAACRGELELFAVALVLGEGVSWGVAAWLHARHLGHLPLVADVARPAAVATLLGIPLVLLPFFAERPLAAAAAFVAGSAVLGLLSDGSLRIAVWRVFLGSRNEPI